MATRQKASINATEVDWTRAAPAVVVLIAGPESILAERAISLIKHHVGPDIERHDITASDYRPGHLIEVSGPSLFAADRLVIVNAVESATDEFITDALAYLTDPADDVCLVLRHGGGNRGKKLLDAVKANRNATVVQCAALKRDSEKHDFVVQEFRRARRSADNAAIRALLDAARSDLRELAAACTQLIGDTAEGQTITEDHVTTYYGGRIEATGYNVADAAIAGRTEHALGLVRHALATGVDPVPIVAAVAHKLRSIALVAATPGNQGAVAKELGMAPWQVDRARKESRNWDADGVKTAMIALADADEEVKGASKDPHYALEKLILTVSRNTRRNKNARQ